MENTLSVWGVIAGILALGGGIAGYVKVIRPIAGRFKKWMTTWESFLEDWAGEEARPGRDRVPGVMERLNDIDGELKRNGGNSIKDSVERIELNMKDLSLDTKEIGQRLIEGDEKFMNIENRLDNLEDKE